MRLKIHLHHKDEEPIINKREDLTSFVLEQIKELSKRKIKLPIKLYHL